jgi:hypothetical protein
MMAALSIQEGEPMKPSNLRLLQPSVLTIRMVAGIDGKQWTPRLQRDSAAIAELGQISQTTVQFGLNFSVLISKLLKTSSLVLVEAAGVDPCPHSPHFTSYVRSFNHRVRFLAALLLRTIAAANWLRSSWDVRAS